MHALPEQFELHRRDVERGHVCTEPLQLQREPPGTATRVEHAVAFSYVAFEHPDVRREARCCRPSVLETCPFALTVLVEELGDRRGTVHAFRRARTSSRSLSRRPESPTR